jgi:hypothetical protein
LTLLLRALGGDLLRHVVKFFDDADLPCLRLVCRAFRDHSSPAQKKCEVDFFRTRALTVFAWESMPGFVILYARTCRACSADLLFVVDLRGMSANRRSANRRFTLQEIMPGFVTALLSMLTLAASGSNLKAAPPSSLRNPKSCP